MQDRYLLQLPQNNDVIFKKQNSIDYRKIQILYKYCLRTLRMTVPKSLMFPTCTSIHSGKSLGAEK